MHLFSWVALSLYLSLLCTAPAAAAHDYWLSPIADKPLQAVVQLVSHPVLITDSNESTDEPDSAIPADCPFIGNTGYSKIITAAARHPLLIAPGIAQPRGPPLRHV
ncbi:hypothetical protein QE250_00455 [Chromatiaceae bacterium AAb-1]|jgi:hypothetical protein|nr:hypothetical protein [Chromatiaceae bacterium AAb-1]